MAEFQEVMKQFDRMCSHYQREHECPMGCTMSGVNISQCRKIAFECPDSVERTVMSWAAEHQVVYPTWGEWFLTTCQVPLTSDLRHNDWETLLGSHIPADIAEKLGIEPKEG